MNPEPRRSGRRTARDASPGRPASGARSALVRGWPLILFAGLAAAGVAAGDLPRILRNATLLCLSCMGLIR